MDLNIVKAGELAHTFYDCLRGTEDAVTRRNSRGDRVPTPGRWEQLAEDERERWIRAASTTQHVLRQVRGADVEELTDHLTEDSLRGFEDKRPSLGGMADLLENAARELERMPFTLRRVALLGTSTSSVTPSGLREVAALYREWAGKLDEVRP